MNLSKQFTPKSSSSSNIGRSSVKIWGQQNKKTTSGLDRTNLGSSNTGFRGFTADKHKISKIFAPKLTVIDNNISVGEQLQNPNNNNVGAVSKNQKITPKNKLNPDKLPIDEPSETLNSVSITQSFINAIVPKISFGKYVFGEIKSKVKINNQDSRNTVANLNNLQAQKNEQKNNVFGTYTSQYTETKEEFDSKPGNDQRHDPEAIFGRLSYRVKVKSKVNFFDSIKSSSNSIASKWWDSIKFDFYDKQWFRRLNYQFVAFDIAKNINRLIIGMCLFGIVGFFAYLSVFDQYFTIKKYTVQYASGSYLNNQQTLELITHFQKNKLYKVFPNNQYWFANNLSLTASAKKIFPEVKSIDVKNRQWPDVVHLEVEINKPILTLWVTENNEQKYWRINDNGKISSQDKAGLWYNLVKVEKPYSLQGNTPEQLSLFNHTFENNPSQRQRFKLTKQLLDYFKNIDIQITTTIFPSISDTDIIMESSGGTKFLFDSSAFEPDTQLQRLDYFLKAKTDKSDFYGLLKKGNYAYFDFRITQKVHICKTTEKCNIKLE